MIAPAKSGLRSVRGIALVITLLMLSVITFLAVAFLVMTRRDTSSKLATLDISTAQSMSEAALARAQAELIARMTAQTDVLAYDYMVSSNFINPFGYTSGGKYGKGVVDSNNVNYDFYDNGNPLSSSGGGSVDWAQNIANLFFDPRPPVFVITNTDPSKPAADFRYYVDLNRNGAFEGSAFRTVDRADPKKFTTVIPNTSGQQGEPEWIGVLADPTHAHSRSNLFIGRYAYLVLPIGKTLDFNFIHNQSQRNLNGANLNQDEFVRDQGVGSWELNLGGYFRDLNTNTWGEAASVPTFNRYRYDLPTITDTSKLAGFNQGYCFDDARSILTNRLAGATLGQSVFGMFGNAILNQFQHDGIDQYSTSPITNLNGPFDFTGITDPEFSVGGITTQPWSGAYNSNMLFDMQDVFNPSMTSVNFTNRLAVQGGATGWPNYPNDAGRIEYDRYTYQRMLATIGTGSQPDNGVYVFTNENVTNTIQLTPTLFRAKMNLNYDNAAQMTAGPYAPMPTNPVPWTDPMKFFTNAADLLLRSQDFPILFINYLARSNGIAFRHFGLSGMNQYPIYAPRTSAEYSTNFHYTSQLHRMFQLAANFYDEGHNSNLLLAANINGTNILSRFPSVFRPLIQTSNNNTAYIVGFELMTSNNFLTQFNTKPWVYLTNAAGINTNENVYGIPWVVGAVKGLPTFNQFSVDTGFGMTRKINVVRPFGVAKAIPTATNQIYLFSISNRFGMDIWNSYQTPFNRKVDISASVKMTVTFTNNSSTLPWGTNIFITTNIAFATNNWSGWTTKLSIPGSMSVPLLVNSNIFASRTSFQPRLYSDGAKGNLRGDFDVGNPNAPYFDTNTFTIHDWHVNVTNYVTYSLVDDETKAPLDFVNIGPVGTSIDVQQIIANLTGGGNNFPVGNRNGGSVNQLVWLTNGANDSLTSPISLGEKNQISIGAALITPSDYPGAAYVQSGSPAVSGPTFLAFLQGADVGTNVMNCPLSPTILFEHSATWAANDPLVHYTAEDLTAPGISNVLTLFNPSVAPPVLSDTLGQLALRYEPWPSSLPGGSGGIGANMTFKDPGIIRPDFWQFPTNLYANVGWIGRVHRGTPWQTIFLKADAKPTDNADQWIGRWVGDLSPGLDIPGESYPTNDWGLLDLFTTAPNDNALRGTVSINQTNTAVWHALLDGVVVLTNPPNGIVGLPINPTQTYGTNANTVDYILNSPEGITALRTNFPNKLFHRVGDILESPTLTVASPYIDFTDSKATPYTDEMVERIPQQIGSLLKVGEPQFVIYAWGQSLRPAALYNPSAASQALFKLCTNYTITGEFLTRTVCHLDLTKSDRFGSNAVIQVDSFNILPAAQ